MAIFPALQRLTHMISQKNLKTLAYENLPQNASESFEELLFKGQSCKCHKFLFLQTPASPTP